ncbi:MAG: SDR family NAD(P)-dependent oxidoreductase [Acidimicrobiales bacterium]
MATAPSEILEPRSIRGRVAVVTGAASGMGRATAELFAAEGALVAACDWNAEGVTAVVDTIVSAGGQAVGIHLDVSDTAAIASAVGRVQAELGPIDILVNNAGIARGGPVEGSEFVDNWDAVVAVNLSAQMHLIRACLDDLARHGEGRIVNISSTEGLGGTAYNASYAAAKHGVIGLTKSLAVELGRRGITVNAVCPGPINTAMTEPIPDDDKAVFARRRTALRRYGEPSEVAHMTLSLVLPAASFVTGVALPVDGGLIARNQ